MTSAEAHEHRRLYNETILLKREVRKLLQKIADLQTSVTKLEGDVDTLEGKVLGQDDLDALDAIKKSVDALDAKIAPPAA